MPSLATRIVRKALRPFYRPYYRYLWRRRFPGTATLERLVRRWESMSERADIPLSSEVWNTAYSEGFWDFLSDADEAERYERISDLLERHIAAGSVLDVGCGDGLLRDHLDGSIAYHGIDLSAEAIARAEARGKQQREATAATFEVADAESWEPPGLFDAVVLNECLYYFERPLQAARRYLKAVAPGGVMVLSMFRGPRSEAIARRLVSEMSPTETVELANSKGRWRVDLFARGEPGVFG